ncbi:MAG: uncharacterized protein H6R26_1704, partial [Proteobacteria bacterium]|nr:uncharacterized protein [Pseudomonadota bacterium]
MSKAFVKLSRMAFAIGLGLGLSVSAASFAAVDAQFLPTGKRITPEAAPNSQFKPLNPQLATRPDFLADHAVDSVLSPDGKTLLILTSGYNRNNGPSGSRVVAESNEYVFVFDISGPAPIQTQAIQVPNTFNGIAWNPNGQEFYDSVSLIDLGSRTEVAELDLRPGKLDPSKAGVPGGTYPLAVASKADDKAYVSSQRDRELVVVGVSGTQLNVQDRIKTQGQPNKMVLNKAQDRLYVASDNSDTALILDTAEDRIRDEILTTAPKWIF